MRARSLETLIATTPARRPRRGFKPCAWYNADTDALEVYLTAEPHLTERLGSLFTLFVSASEPGKVVGLAIDDFRRHFGRENGLDEVLIEGARATVKLLVYGALFAHELALRGKRPSRSKRARTGSGSERLNAVMEQVGDTEVVLQNLEAIAS